MNLYNTSIVGVINLFVTKNVFFFFKLNYTSQYTFIIPYYSPVFKCFFKNVLEMCLIKIYFVFYTYYSTPIRCL